MAKKKAPPPEKVVGKMHFTATGYSVICTNCKAESKKKNLPADNVIRCPKCGKLCAIGDIHHKH